MKFKSQINTFASGIVHRDLTHRSDIEKIQQGCTELTNFIVGDMGGVKRRFSSYFETSKASNSIYQEYCFKQSPDDTYRIKLNTGNILATTDRMSVVNTVRGVASGTTNVIISSTVEVYNKNGTRLPVFIDSITSSPVDTPSTVGNGNGSLYSYTRTPVYPYSPPDSVGCYVLRNDETTPYHTTQSDNKLVFARYDTLPFILEFVPSGAKSSANTLYKYYDHFVLYPISYDTGYPTASSMGTYGAFTVPLEVERLTKSNSHYMSARFYRVPNEGGALETVFYCTIVFDGAFGGNNPEVQPIIDRLVPFRFRCTADPAKEFCVTPLGSIYVDGVTTHTCIGSTTAPAGFTVGSIYMITHVSNPQWNSSTLYPTSVTNFKGRLTFGGNRQYPNRMWVNGLVSTSKSIQLFARMLAQDSGSTTDVTGFGYYNLAANLKGIAFQASFNDSDSGAISWLKGRKILHVGSTSGEHQVEIQDETYTYGYIKSSRVSAYSMNSVQAEEGDNKLFYVSNMNTELRYISTENGDYASMDLSASILYRKFTNIKQLKWSPTLKTMFVVDNGVLKTVSLNKETQLISVSEMKLPFTSIITINLIPWSTGEILYIYGSVSPTEKYIAACPILTPYKLDFITNEVYPYNTVQPSAYWGKSVVVFDDNGNTYDTTVSDTGYLDVNFSITGNPIVYIGLPFVSQLTVVPVQAGNQGYKISTGSIKRIHEITFDASGTNYYSQNDSTTFYIGNKGSRLETASASANGSFVVVPVSNEYDYDVQPTLVCDSLKELTINGLIVSGTTYED